MPTPSNPVVYSTGQAHSAMAAVKAQLERLGHKVSADLTLIDGIFCYTKVSFNLSTKVFWISYGRGMWEQKLQFVNEAFNPVTVAASLSKHVSQVSRIRKNKEEKESRRKAAESLCQILTEEYAIFQSRATVSNDYEGHVNIIFSNISEEEARSILTAVTALGFQPRKGG